MLSLLLAMALAAAVQAESPQPLNEDDWWYNIDYPEAARARADEGMVGYQLDVSRDGRPTGCRVTEPSGKALLDVATCELLLARARFEPARDASGSPVAGRFSARRRWHLPDGPLRTLEPWSMVARASLSPAGEMVACTPVSLGPVPDGDEGTMCDYFGGSPPSLRLYLRGGPGPEPTHVEMAMNIDGMSGYPLRHLEPGHRITFLSESRFEISAQGRPENCRLVDHRGPDALRDLICKSVYDLVFRTEAGQAQRREGSMVMAVSIETGD